VHKKSITYTNLDGQTVTEEFHFNLTKAELIEMEMAPEGGLRQQMMNLDMVKDRGKVMTFIKELIRVSVGRREGDRFVKSPEIVNHFMQTEAYSELFIDLLKNPGGQAEFVAKIMPADLISQVDVEGITRQAFADHGVPYPEKEVDVVVPTPDVPIPDIAEIPPVYKGLLEYTNEELIDMPASEFHALVGRHKGAVPKPLLVLIMQRAHES